MQKQTLNITIGNALTYYNHLNIPEKSIDLCLFDPPFYAEKKTFKSRSVNNIPEMEWITEDYVHTMSIFFMNLRDVMKDEGWVCFKCDDRTFGELYSTLQKIQTDGMCYIFGRNVIWNKIKIGMGSYIRPQHEIISCWRMGRVGIDDRRFATDKSYFMYPAWRTDDETKQMRMKIHGDVDRKGWHGGSKGLSFPSVISVLPLGQGIKGQPKNHDHLCKTPKDLWIPFLRWLCPTNGVVFDPFAGTGSIGKACIEAEDLFKENKKLRYIGMEIDPRYKECWII